MFYIQVMIKEERIHLLLNWSIRKIKFNSRNRGPFFSEREIWWAAFGQNVGTEIYGKGPDSTRPIIIFKKHSHNSALVFPLTTFKGKEYRGSKSIWVADKRSLVLFSQARTISSKRLVRMMKKLNTNVFAEVKKEFVDYLL